VRQTAAIVLLTTANTMVPIQHLVSIVDPVPTREAKPEGTETEAATDNPKKRFPL
jgi:hypothetical protein